jgi:hypothetical protein
MNIIFCLCWIIKIDHNSYIFDILRYIDKHIKFLLTKKSQDSSICLALESENRIYCDHDDIERTRVFLSILCKLVWLREEKKIYMKLLPCTKSKMFNRPPIPMMCTHWYRTCIRPSVRRQYDNTDSGAPNVDMT